MLRDPLVSSYFAVHNKLRMTTQLFHSSTPSRIDDRAQRLPMQFAGTVVAIDTALFVIGMALVLLPAENAQMREVYQRPGVWMPMLVRLVMGWLWVGALAWSHARQAIDRRGEARVAALSAPRLRFAGAYFAVMVLDFYALSPLLYQLQLVFMPGGSMQGAFGDISLRWFMAASVTVQAMIQLIVLTLGVWAATRFALRERGSDAKVGPAEAQTGQPASRFAIIVLAAVFLVALQLWIANIAGNWFNASRDPDLPSLLINWIVMPLAVFGLAVLGGSRGLRTQPSKTRPFRAAAAAGVAFVALQILCVTIALGWIVFMAASSTFAGSTSMASYGLALAATYFVLLVILTRVSLRGFYKRYL